jgi:hypothetical protein
MKDGNIRKNLVNFIDNIMDNKLKAAHTDLSSAINKKIKRQIINNNKKSIF